MSEADEDGDDMKRRFGGQDAACLPEGNKLSQTKGADEAEGIIRAKAERDPFFNSINKNNT